MRSRSLNELGNGRVNMWLSPINRQDAMSALGLGRVETPGPAPWNTKQMSDDDIVRQHFSGRSLRSNRSDQRHED